MATFWLTPLCSLSPVNSGWSPPKNATRSFLTSTASSSRRPPVFQVKNLTLAFETLQIFNFCGFSSMSRNHTAPMNHDNSVTVNGSQDESVTVQMLAARAASRRRDAVGQPFPPPKSGSAAREGSYTFSLRGSLCPPLPV